MPQRVSCSPSAKQAQNAPQEAVLAICNVMEISKDKRFWPMPKGRLLNYLLQSKKECEECHLCSAFSK